ncbi:MAG: DUF58 domain-containing protein [Myxococcales bacterium]|nr:DUF58 domain-containing protein [Myxococcales bacterium]
MDVRRPTRRGWAAIALAFVLTDLGALGGNNLVVLVASVAWAAVLTDGVLGWLNLRGVVVRRQLPDELYARTGCRGAFVVGRAGRLPGLSLVITDGPATASAERVDREVVLPAWWRFPERGPARLEGLEVRSSFPFGLFDHRVRQGEPAEVLVYPCPRQGSARAAHRPSVEGRPSERREGTGDLRDLRPYRPGDRLRSIHWPTSARVGRPMVGVRSAEEDAGRLVELPADPGEDALERATGALLEAWAEGVPVGVRGLEPELAVPRRGIRWKRRLLDGLAMVRT